MQPSRFSSVAAHSAILLALISVPGAAQSTGDSTRAQPAADSSAAGYGDTTRQSGVDTSRGKAAADSARVRGDSSASIGASAPASTPADSVLSGACTSMRAGAVAPGVLLVLFRDSATAEERDEAVKEVGGMVGGQAPGGGEYVRVASDTISSRDLADRLVLNPAIASVSERTCPPSKP